MQGAADAVIEVALEERKQQLQPHRVATPERSRATSPSAPALDPELPAETEPLRAARRLAEEPSLPSAAVSGAAPDIAPHDGVEGTEEAMQRSLIRRHLEQFKYYPASARRRGIGGSVEVAFRLDRRGRAGGVRVLKGSGYPILDEAALRTVRRAEPFPADGGSFRFHLHFRAS